MKLLRRPTAQRYYDSTGAFFQRTDRREAGSLAAAWRRATFRAAIIGPTNSGKSYALLSLKKTIDRRMHTGRYNPDIAIDYLSPAFQRQLELAESGGRSERTPNGPHQPDEGHHVGTECIGFSTSAGALSVEAAAGEYMLDRGAVDVPRLRSRLLGQGVDLLLATVCPYRHDQRVGFWAVCSLARQFLQSRENLKEIAASFSTPEEMDELRGLEDRSFGFAILIALHETVGLTPAGVAKLHPAWKRFSTQELNAARIDQNLNATFDLPGKDPFYFAGIPAATGKKLLSDIRQIIRKIVERDCLLDPVRALSANWPREFMVVVSKADVASVTGIPEYHLREIGRRVFPNRRVTDQQVVLVGAKNGKDANTLLDVLANGGVHDRADDLLDAVMASQAERIPDTRRRFWWERLRQARVPLSTLAIAGPALAAAVWTGSGVSFLVLSLSVLAWLLVWLFLLARRGRRAEEKSPAADWLDAVQPYHDAGHVHSRPLPAGETKMRQAVAKAEA